ncbi:MAG: hypothetical protein GEV28_36385, partial [Actinophytocola sp.]|nr:hypothetical protein [Actinophytocola sp.]
MPPSRRRPPPSSGQVPPVRRPRVAGLRNRPATSRDEDDPQLESMSGVLDIHDPEPGDPEPDAAEAPGRAAETGAVGAETGSAEAAEPPPV